MAQRDLEPKAGGGTSEGEGLVLRGDCGVCVAASRGDCCLFLVPRPGGASGTTARSLCSAHDTLSAYISHEPLAG